MIGGDQGVVENWMDAPCLWQLQFAVNSPGGNDLERTVSVTSQRLVLLDLSIFGYLAFEYLFLSRAS
jgi:hypothetical protein